MTGDLVFSADPARTDVERVHRWLAEESYWARGRTRELHEAAMAGSRNYGVFDAETGEQLAYARVITDGATSPGSRTSSSIRPHAGGARART